MLQPPSAISYISCDSCDSEAECRQTEVARRGAGRTRTEGKLLGGVVNI